MMQIGLRREEKEQIVFRRATRTIHYKMKWMVDEPNWSRTLGFSVAEGKGSDAPKLHWIREVGRYHWRVVVGLFLPFTK